MTEQEFRDKIAKIIENDHCIRADYSDCEGCEYKNCFSCKPYRLADALIAAGIGDVSELKKHRVIVEQSPVPTDDNCYILPNTSPIIKQLYSGEEVEQIVKERDTYKRALKLAEELGELCAPASNYIQQAEKELAEEGKE